MDRPQSHAPGTFRCDGPINTTPDVASPSLTPNDRAPLLSNGAATGIALALSCWGFAMVAAAFLRSL